ncbi:MAG: hypothetical protein ACYC4N_06410 [Pirellulaceae bacterium]
MDTRGADRHGRYARTICGLLPAALSIGWLAVLGVDTRVALAERVVRESAKVAGTEYKLVVELTRRDTFVTLPTSANIADTCITLVRVDGLPSRHRLVPASGIAGPGQSVDIVLDKSPDVHIRLSIVTRGNELAVKVSPLISWTRGEPVDFTFERVQRTVWTLQRRIKELQRRIAALRKEYQLVDTWLATPGNKPLDLVKATHLRRKLLQRELLACQRDLPSVQKRYAALCKTAELAQRIHGATVIRFSVGQQGGREH